MIVRFRKCLLLLAIPILLFLFGINVKAIGLDVTDFKVVGKNETINVNDLIFNDNKVTSNITFKKLDDYVCFEFKLYNHDEEKYIIESINSNNTNDNIVIEYDYDTKEITKDKYATITLKLSYKNLLKNVEEIKLKDLVLTITLTKENGEKEAIIVNPITKDNIFLSISIFIISLITLYLCLKYLKIKRKFIYPLFVIVLLSFPFIIFAKEKYEINIYFTDITIKGEFDIFNVTIDKDNLEPQEIIKRQFGSTLGELDVPTKKGYAFSHWVDSNNNTVDKNTIIKNDLSIKAIYNLINYNLTYELDDGVAENPNTYNIESNITLNNPVKEGYIFVGWTRNNEETKVIEERILPGTTGDITFTAHYEPANTSYKVSHYIEKLDGAYEIKEQDNLIEKTNTSVTATNKVYTGFTYDVDNTNNIKTGSVKPDGSLELKLYYKRNSYKVTYQYEGDVPTGAPAVPQEKQYKYGASVPLEANPTLANYTFSGWNNTGVFTMPANDVVIKGSWTLTGNIGYKIEHYQQNIDNDNYTIAETETGSGQVGTGVTAVSKTYTGFTFDEDNANNVKTGNIQEDGGLTLKLYYKRNTHKVIYSYTNTPTGYSALPDEETYRYGKTVTVAGLSTAPGYTFAWDRTGTFTMPDENVYITGTFTPGTSNYTIEHWTEKLDGTYELLNDNTETKSGTTDTTAVATPKTITGFTQENSIPGTESSGNIDGTGTRILKLYYRRNRYNVTYTVTGDIPTGYIAPTGLTNVKYETEVTVENAPSVTGYDFSGWTTTNATISEGKFYMPDNAVTLTGTWTAHTNNVTYTVSGNIPTGYTAPEGTNNVKFGTEVNVEDNPSQTGYEFSGWSTTDATISGGKFSMPDHAVTITGTWTVHTYNVTYTVSGDIPNGYSAPEGTSNVPFGSEVTVENAPNQTGYDFSGWSTSDVTISNNKFNMPDNAVTITGTWTAHTNNVTYTVSGDIPTGYTAPEGSTNVKFGTEVTVEDSPTVAGYDFSGWSTTNVTISDNKFNMPDSEVVITGTWTAHTNNVVYTVTGDIPANYTVPSGSTNVKFGTQVNVENNPSVTGYDFSGWTTSDVTVSDGKFNMPDKTVTLTGTWTAHTNNVTYTVSGDIPSGYSAPTGNTNVKYGTEVTVENNPTVAGYTFSGWTTTDATVSDGKFSMPDKAVSFTGTWTVINSNYKVEYYYQENGTYPSTATNFVNRSGLTNTTAEVTSEDKTPPTGYALDESSNANYVYSGTITGDGQLTLKVYFKQQFSVTYLPGTKGTFEETTTNGLDYDSYTPAPPTITGAQGYTHTGWDPVISLKVTQNTTYTALWQANANTPYKVEYYYQENGTYPSTTTHYDDRSGTTDTTASVVDNDKVPQQTGYVLDESANADYVYSGTITADGQLTLKVYFKQQFSVTYNPGTKGTFEETTTNGLDYDSDTPAPPTITGAQGYTHTGWNPTISPKVTQNTTYTALWTPNSNTLYKVEHYTENVDGSWKLETTENKYGTTDTTGVASEIVLPGFTYDSNNSNNVKTGNINGDGSLILKLYYTRDVYTVTYSYTGTVPAGASSLPTNQSYKHGETVILANKATAPGYTFDGWKKDDTVVTTFEMPIGNVTVTGSFAYATNTPYKVEHYGQDVNGNYVLMKTDNKTGTTNANVSAAQMNVDHQIYTYNPLHPDQVSSGRIKADGSLVLKMYYLRNKYDLHLINESNVDGATSGEYYYGTQLTLTAHNRDEDDEPFTKWSDGTTNKTKTITITQDMTIGPYYHVYTITLIDKDPRTTGISSQVQTQTIKVDPGQSVNLPILPPREECKYAKDSTHQSPEARECSYIAEFLGWFTTEEYTEEIESPYTAPGDVTLYAKWNAVYYHYRISEVREYSGTQGDYDDSGVILYNIDNRNRDFNITFDIVEYDVSSFEQPTIMNGKYEKQSLNYPGFVIRFNPSGNDGWKKIQITSRWKTLQIEKYMSSTTPWKVPATATVPIHIEVTRRNGVVKATYTTSYSGSGGITDSGYVVNLFDQNNNPPNLPDKVATTVTFGATIDEYGIPMRFFKGKLANIDVKMASDLYDPLT